MKVCFKEGKYEDLPKAIENSEPGTLLFCDNGKLFMKLEDTNKEKEDNKEE